MGGGIAFDKKKDDTIDENSIEKRFYLEKAMISDSFIELLREIPGDIINVTHEIIEYIEANIGRKVDDRIYLTLLDQLERYSDGWKSHLI